MEFIPSDSVYIKTSRDSRGEGGCRGGRVSLTFALNLSP